VDILLLFCFITYDKYQIRENTIALGRSIIICTKFGVIEKNQISGI
jgi:hypothetical protein